LNAKNLTIGGAFTVVVAGIIYQYGELITPDFLLMTALVVSFVFLSYGTSWTITEAYKRLYLHQKDWGKENTKRKIYRCAIWSAGLTMLACGSLFLLAEGVPVKWQIVVGVFWTLACILVGFSSPIIWKWAFETLLPRFNRFVIGTKTIDENESEAEALNRPSEKPE
jgi:hypothetical protein